MTKAFHYYWSAEFCWEMKSPACVLRMDVQLVMVKGFEDSYPAISIPQDTSDSHDGGYQMNTEKTLSVISPSFSLKLQRRMARMVQVHEKSLYLVIIIFTMETKFLLGLGLQEICSLIKNK